MKPWNSARNGCSKRVCYVKRLSFVHMGPSRRCVLAWLCLLPCAAENVATVSSSDCERRLLIGPTSQLSGSGKLWEYYHFLIDFAPRVAYALRNSTCSRTVIFAPNYYHDERFSLSLRRTPRTMAPLCNVLFGRYGLRMARYGVGRAPGGVEALDFNPKFRWGNQPAEWLDYFREYARALAAPVPALGSRLDVLIVRRGMPDPNAPKCLRPVRCGTGGQRRRLPAAFFDQGLAFFGNHSIRAEVAVLERLPLIEQVRLFAQAPVIIAMHGAGISNIIFATSGASLIEVGLRSSRCYVRLAHKMRVHYFYDAMREKYGPHGKHAGFSRSMEKVSMNALHMARKRRSSPADFSTIEEDSDSRLRLQL